MNNFSFKRLFGTVVCGCCIFSASAQVTLNLDAGKRGPTIGDRHYGIFFEEINHAGDGGLYAELIQNRSFEDNAGNPDKWWNIGNASASIITDNLLNNAQQHALRLQFTASGDGIRNEGFWGINVVNGRTYKLSFWARSEEGYSGYLNLELQSEDGTVLGSKRQIVSLGTGWKKYTAEITATGNDPNGWFAIKGTKAGVIDLDVVSLFPPTYKNRENGCRTDLAEMLAAMKPAFVRFPGGCYVEGNGSLEQTNRFEWKNTIGNIEERPGHRNNNWGYNVSDGFGFHEMLQLTEDIGAEPLFVVNMGMGHGWVVDYNAIDEYIQEALDAIEYCNGDAQTTKWGALRAQNGHPEPFNLRLLEIGNENYNFYSENNADQSDHYAERYYQFYKAIKAKYPEVLLIGNVESWGTDDPSWRNPYPVEAVDEHYYRSPSWFVSQYNKYDNYSRSSYKVYAGEYAVTQDFGVNGHLTAALGEAVYMQGMENNSDVCIMNSYAPIFVNENHINPWRPDMIRFNNAESYGTPSYHVQQLMPNYLGKQNVKWTEENNMDYKNEGMFGLSTWQTAANFDNVKITGADGNVLFSDDFSTTKSEWSINGGTWSTRNGVLTQSDRNMEGKLYVCNLTAGSKYTFEVDATKTRGAEGFLIAFNYQDENNYCWWNLGGWSNTKHAVEVCTNGNKTTAVSADGSLETNRTYHIKVEVDGLHITCYLDNQVVHDFNLPGNRKVYVSSSIDDEAGMMYVKLVNTTGTAQTATINLANARITEGKAVVLTSANGTDENTTENPKNVAPAEYALGISGNNFTYEVPAYSLNILCLKVADVTLAPEVKEEITAPVVAYSFENGTAYDDQQLYAGQLHNALVTQMDDGNHALYIKGGTEGYMDLGAEMARHALSSLTGDYSIAIDMLLPGVGNLANYSWAYSMHNGTSQYIGLINTANNTDWYYGINNGTAEDVKSGSGLTYNEWHNITVTREGHLARIYVDGYMLKETACTLNPADLASDITAAYIGRSPFDADSDMTDAYFDNFRIFDEALTAQQVRQLYENVRTQSTQSGTVNIEADASELGTMLNKFNYLHATTQLPAETEKGTPVSWTLAGNDNGYISLDGSTLTVNRLATPDSEPIESGTLTAHLEYPTGEKTLQAVVKVAPDDNKYGYLYCFMNANKEITNYALGTKENLGREFNVLLGGDEIFNTSELAGIEGGTRDAFLCRGEGGDGYLMSTTDMQVAVSGVWNNYGLNLMRSDDLIHWESVTFDFRKGKSIFSDPDADTGIYTTDEEYARITRVWAPQIIWDGNYDNGKGGYLVYYSLLSSNSGDNHDRIFYSYADRDFRTLTQPRIFFDPGISVIDGDILYNPYDGLYHMFYKREGASGTDRGIYEATSPALVSDKWTEIMHVTNEGSNQVEGSSCIRRINEDVYNLYYMRYSGGSAYKYCETDHLGLNVSGSAALKGTGAFQHGSFMTVTEEEYIMLQAWSDVKQLLPAIEATRDETGSNVFDAAIAQAETALSLTTVAELSTALPEALRALQNAQTDYIQEVCDKASAGNPADLTFILINPEFDNGSTGWNGTSFTAVSAGIAEQYSKTFDNYQLLQNMPDGDYRFECQGFYRFGGSSEAYSAHQNGTERLYAELYVNEEASPFVSLYSTTDYTYSPYTYPDNVWGANSAFNDDNNYHGNVVTSHLAQKGDLKVGMRKTAFVNADWTAFDNFRLYYLGGGTNINEVRTAAPTDAPVDVYTLSGMRMRSGVHPAKAVEGLPAGIYIIGKKKVIVK